MNTEDKGVLDTLVLEKIEEDTDFQDSLVDLSDDERDETIKAKSLEIREQEFINLQQSASKNEELATNYKTRAEKAEGKLKGTKPSESKPTEQDNPDISSKDMYALISAQVPQEDVDEVVKASKLLNKPIAEVLKDNMVVSILKTREEHRKTADATNTKTSRPGSKGITDEQVLDNLSKGEIPEKGSKEAEKLFWARRGGKRG